MELRLAGIIWWKWHSRALGMDIFNRGEWLWNPTKLFVVGFFSLFWPWPCTKHEISSISFSGLFSLKFQKEKALGARLGIYFVNYDFCFQFGCHYICFRAMYYCKYTLINWCCCIFVGIALSCSAFWEHWLQTHCIACYTFRVLRLQYTFRGVSRTSNVARPV